MRKTNRKYEVRPLGCDWALDIPLGDTTVVLYFNSRNNAELVKDILEWEDNHPNEAAPYQPTLTPPNEPLTLEELREMDGKPVWVEDVKHWALIEIEKGGRWKDIPFAVWPEDGLRFTYNIEDRGLHCYRRPPEREEETKT